ncbi:MAG TPA: PAS domain-containing protein [Opitutaceae bacterium]
MSDINLTVSDTTEPARSPHTLLLIENDPREADLVRFHLGNGSPELFTIVDVTSLAAAAQFLKEKPVDAVVVDLNLPDVRAIDVIHWARGVSNRAAVVLCSGTDDDQLQLLAYKEGIKEFVRKDRSQLPFLTHNILFAMERFRASRLREQLLKVVGQNPDAMVVTNTAGRVYFVNDAAVRLFQRSRKEMLESTIRFPIKEAELEEFEIVRKDGKRCAEIHLVSIEWDDRPALLATLRDVTDHRRISNRVREKQKLEAIGLLAGGIAHDFNNIFTIILGNAQLAQVDVLKSHLI